MAKAKSVARRTEKERKGRRDQLVKELRARVKKLEEENDVLLRAYAVVTGTPIEPVEPTTILGALAPHLEGYDGYGPSNVGG